MSTKKDEPEPVWRELLCFVDAFGNADGTGGADETAEMAADAFGTEDLRFAFFIKSYRLMASVGA